MCPQQTLPLRVPQFGDLGRHTPLEAYSDAHGDDDDE